MIFLFDSALATVLSDAKANVGNTPNVAAPQSVAVDDSVFMLALAIFILSAPKEVVLASDLQSQCINVFNRCITSTNIQVSRLFYPSFWVRAKSFTRKCKKRYSHRIHGFSVNRLEMVLF